MSEEWDFEKYQEKFYFYTKKELSNDDFYKVEEIGEILPCFADLHSKCLHEIRGIFEVSSLPFFVAFLASGISQTTLQKELIIRAKAGCEKSKEFSDFIFKEKLYLKALDAVVPTFQHLSDVEQVKEKYYKLYSSILANAYGCIEKYSKLCLKENVIKDYESALTVLSNNGLKIGSSSCNTLLNKIKTQLLQGGVTLEELYDLHILNKGFNISQYSLIFKELYGFSISESDLLQLKKIESIRHIIIHRNGKIDAKFVSEVDTEQRVGETIDIGVDELKNLCSATVEYFYSLFSVQNKKF
ncbi:hypothetical protein [Vibrio anguillarum]|uniref:hypothetical protein n=1 Tax=Vibrio anguillarum TaxID=55601 RepID=UPI0009801884|nr:hypothetical protein [Vibrio anguillarum]AQP37184.1 hypothetical protein AA909_12875 [Vibrio anguillarum]